MPHCFCDFSRNHIVFVTVRFTVDERHIRLFNCRADVASTALSVSRANPGDTVSN